MRSCGTHGQGAGLRPLSMSTQWTSATVANQHWPEPESAARISVRSPVRQQAGRPERELPVAGVAIARLGDPGPGRYAPPHGALRNMISTLVGRAYPGTTPREQRSLMACTSYRSSVFQCISAETLATPWVTVLWLRPPSSRPTCVNAKPISCTSRYIATCLGTDMARLRLTLTRSSTPRPEMAGNF